MQYLLTSVTENCTRPSSNEPSPPHATNLEVLNPPFDISHELRTPLTVIQGTLGLLDSGKLGSLSSQGKRLVTIANQNVDRLLRLTKIIEQQKTAPFEVMSSVDLNRLRLELDFQTALCNHEFELMYQPIINLNTHQLTGFEALTRWQHPQLGAISPIEFIPLAESTDLVAELGVWALQKACQQLQSWQQDLGHNTAHLTMNVNLSGKQLSSKRLCQDILEILNQTNLATSSLKLEITESAVIDNLPLASQTLEQLKVLGIQLYIDDFGTGYSCLNRLYELPLDGLKIDRAFVQQSTSERGEQLIRAIVNLATNIGIDVIAEGVETQEQLWKLNELGCQLAQGYYFAHPLDSKLATEFIQQNILDYGS